MFRTLCFMSMAAVISAQTDVSPLDIEELPDQVVVQWCSTGSDCLTSRPTVSPAEITCTDGRCNCGAPYELFESSICKRPEDPAPEVQVIVELTWDDLRCGELPANFREVLMADLQRIYGTTQVDIRLKCGSVIVAALLKQVSAATAARINIATAIANSNTAILAGGAPSKIDTYGGSGSCVLIEGQDIVLSIGGTCQPFQCSPGYTLIAVDDVTVLDVCEKVRVPVSDDELSGGAIVGIVTGVVGGVLIIVVIVFFVCKKKEVVPEENESEENINKNGPDF